MALNIPNIFHGGQTGNFATNAESFGWRSATDRSCIVVRPVGSVRKAEWREGALAVLCDLEDGSGPEVVIFDGFGPQHYDELWRFFEKQCEVFIKKHRTTAEVSAEDFDAAMRGVEEAADGVDQAASGVQKKAREADLMKRVEGIRDGLHLAVSGDKHALSQVFAANGCERIGRLRLVVDTVQLEMYRDDARWLQVANLATSVESVLKELGTFRPWRPPEDGAHASMLRRLMVLELRGRHGEDADTAVDAAAAPSADPLRSGPVVGKVRLEGLPPPPLMGLLPPGADVSGLQPLAEPAFRDPLAPAPAAAAEVAEAAAESAEAEEWSREEVSDPNAVRASAPDDQLGQPSGAARARRGAADGRRAHYMYPKSILEGWVWKRSQYLKKWRRRWLVLMPDHFATYKARCPGGSTERVERGSVVSIHSADNEVLQTRCFCVTAMRKKVFTTRAVSLYMVCDDEAEKREWMAKISEVLGQPSSRPRRA